MDDQKTRSEKFGDFANWAYENWQRLLLIPIFGLSLPFIIYSFLTSDPNLRDLDKIHEIEQHLEAEMKLIKLPEKSAVNKFEILSKPLAHVFVQSRYRTETGSASFLRTMREQLESTDWVFYRIEKEGAFTTYRFCRGKYDSSLSREDGQGIWADGGEYWRLSFRYGLRPVFGNEGRPKECQ